MKQPSVNIKNKRATFDYELMDTYTAGIVLTGTEIKSIRLGKASLVDTFCYFAKGELWVKNMHIAEYFYGSYNNHTARRDRKLLLNKKELEKIQRGMKDPVLLPFLCVCLSTKKVWRNWSLLWRKVKNSTINGNQLKKKMTAETWPECLSDKMAL